MAQRTFTATHGPAFQDEGASQPWAHFIQDPARTTPNGEKVYVFTTDDAKVADRLAKIDEYSITEVKTAASTKS